MAYDLRGHDFPEVLNNSYPLAEISPILELARRIVETNSAQSPERHKFDALRRLGLFASLVEAIGDQTPPAEQVTLNGLVEAGRAIWRAQYPREHNASDLGGWLAEAALANAVTELMLTTEATHDQP